MTKPLLRSTGRWLLGAALGVALAHALVVRLILDRLRPA
jgi:hypothetical protein